MSFAPEGAKAALIAPKIGGVTDDAGKTVVPQHALSAAPSVFFDAVVLALSEEGAEQLATEAAASISCAMRSAI